MPKILGDSLTVRVNISNTQTPVAFATSATLNVTAALLEAIVKGGNGWREVEAGSRSWSISSDSLTSWTAETGFADTPTILDLCIARTEVAVEMGQATGTSGNVYYTGDTYITASNIAAGAGAYSTDSFTFEGNGPLTKVTAS